MAWIILALGGVTGVSAADTKTRLPDTVTNVHQMYGLTREETLSGRAVQLKAVVLSFDPSWNQLYVHDGREVLYLSSQGVRAKLEPGQSVSIKGTPAWVDGHPALTNFTIETRGRGKLPEARRSTLSQLGERYGGWVETTGRVRAAETSSGRLTLLLVGDGRICSALVLGQPTTNDYRSLLDCRINVRGVNTSKVFGGRVESCALTVPGFQEVRVLEPADAPASQSPVVSVDSLLNRELGPWTNDLVHLNGLVAAYQPGESVTLKDPTGLIQARVLQTTLVQPGERVDLWGFLKVSRDGVIIREAYFAVLRARAENPAPGPGARAGNKNSTQPLKLVSQVLRLAKEEVAQGFPVRFQGIVTYADREWGNGFLQDQTGGIYFDAARLEVRSGDYIELRGETAPGGFAPVVINCSVRVSGPTNFPAPVKVDLEDLLSGHLDADWVELEGVVRRIEEQSSHVILSLVTRKGRFKVVIPALNLGELPTELIDSLVSVKGACGLELNTRGQLTGVRLHTPGRAQITVIEPAPADPFAIPAAIIAKVATFDAERRADRRVKVSGIVTLSAPGQGFFVQDESGGIRIWSQQTNHLTAGDRVEVIGFPATSDFSPCLEEATFRSHGSGAPPVAKRLNAEAMLAQPANDGLRVQLEARLVQTVPHSAQPRLVFQDGPIIFTAHLPGGNGASELPSLRAGSLVRLTGVGSIQSGESHEPETFRLLLAQAKEVELLEEPAWWTTRHTMLTGGGVAAAMVAGLGWIGLLRRQVRTQTGLIRKKHKELLETSRLAGMAEVATGVLHNVGNVLNSVNVTTTLVGEGIRKSRIGNVGQVARLLAQREDIADFMVNDPKGRQIPAYLGQLGEHLEAERSSLLTELDSLTKNVEHIKDIIAMQQNYAKVAGVAEPVKASELIEDAVQMNANALARHDVKVLREYDPRLPEITVEKHKVLQILVNLIQNAKYACDESGRTDKRLTLRTFNGEGRIKIAVSDNGVGIPTENLTRIFNHGFSTRKDGHGFGLHSGALAAGEMGGSLRVESDGPGRGATFTLEIPLNNLAP